MMKRATLVLCATTTMIMAVPVAADAQPGQCTYTGGTTWNVKESFNNYIEGAIANGPQYAFPGGLATGDGMLTAGHKASRTLQWPVDGVQGKLIRHGGSVHYTGHNQYSGTDAVEAADYFTLDTRFSNLSLEVTGSTGRILIDYQARTFVDTSTVAEFRQGTQVELATLTFDSAVDLNSQGRVDAVGTAVLSGSGEAVFGGYYEAGTTLADVELDLHVSGCGSDDYPNSPEPPANQDTPAATASSVDDAGATLTRVLDIGTLIGMGGLALAVLNYFIQSAQSWI